MKRIEIRGRRIGRAERVRPGVGRTWMESSSGTAREAAPSSCVAWANTPSPRRARDGDARGCDAPASRRPVRNADAETGDPATGDATLGDAARRARALATGDPRVAAPDIAEMFAASMARRCARRARRARRRARVNVFPRDSRWLANTSLFIPTVCRRTCAQSLLLRRSRQKTRADWSTAGDFHPTVHDSRKSLDSGKLSSLETKSHKKSARRSGLFEKSHAATDDPIDPPHRPASPVPPPFDPNSHRP